MADNAICRCKLCGCKIKKSSEANLEVIREHAKALDEKIEEHILVIESLSAKREVLAVEMDRVEKALDAIE